LAVLGRNIQQLGLRLRQQELDRQQVKKKLKKAA
jgi:hypothetical protein